MSTQPTPTPSAPGPVSVRSRAPDPKVVAALGIRPKRGSRRAIEALVAVLLLAAIALGVRAFVRRRASSGMPRYKFEKIEQRDVRVTVSATGKLQGLNTVEVGAEVTGRVLRVLVDYNDKVQQGQLLAEIDPEQLRAAAEESRAQVVSAESNIKTAEATAAETSRARKRAEEQAKAGLVSDKDLETAVAAAVRAEAALAAAKASAELSRAGLKSAESKLRKTKIYAPIDGVVLSRSVDLGQTVTAGFQTPVLFKLAEDLSKLALHVDIDEADVGRVREGLEASFTVDAYPQRVFSSRVMSFRNEPKTSQNVVTYEAVLSVDNSDRALRPGMTATATITSELLHSVLVAPNAALRFTPPAEPRFGPPVAQVRSEEKHVYVLRNGLPATVVVKTGASDGHVTQLLEKTVAPGDEVIVDVIERP